MQTTHQLPSFFVIVNVHAVKEFQNLAGVTGFVSFLVLVVSSVNVAFSGGKEAAASRSTPECGYNIISIHGLRD